MELEDIRNCGSFPENGQRMRPRWTGVILSIESFKPLAKKRTHDEKTPASSFYTTPFVQFQQKRSEEPEATHHHHPQSVGKRLPWKKLAPSRPMDQPSVTLLRMFHSEVGQPRATCTCMATTMVASTSNAFFHWQLNTLIDRNITPITSHICRTYWQFATFFSSLVNPVKVQRNSSSIDAWGGQGSRSSPLLF